MMMMSRIAGVVLLGAAVLGIAAVAAGQRGVAAVEPAPFAVAEPILAEIKARDAGQLAISEADGQFLRVLVGTHRTRRALEIGGASGYSGIWIGHGLRETGGQLITIEYDPVRAREAADNIARAGLSDIVRVIAGDAFVEIPKLEGTFDMIFLDAWKQDYKRFFELTFPRLDAGGVFLAHNVVNKREDMGDFLDAIWTRPGAWTSVIAPSGEGMSLTYKVR